MGHPDVGRENHFPTDPIPSFDTTTIMKSCLLRTARDAFKANNTTSTGLNRVYASWGATWQQKDGEVRHGVRESPEEGGFSPRIRHPIVLLWVAFWSFFRDVRLWC